MRPDGTAGPLALLVLVVAADLWVYRDARARQLARRPVVTDLGRIHLESPSDWLLGCAVLLVVVLPLYLAARSRG